MGANCLRLESGARGLGSSTTVARLPSDGYRSVSLAAVSFVFPTPLPRGRLPPTPYIKEITPTPNSLARAAKRSGVDADNECFGRKGLQLWLDLLRRYINRIYSGSRNIELRRAQFNFIVRRFNMNCFYELCAVLPLFHLHILLEI